MFHILSWLLDINVVYRITSENYKAIAYSLLMNINSIPPWRK